MEMADSPLAQVQAQIARTCTIARRDRGEVTLMAVSKTRTAAEIAPLLKRGQRHFGENRVQEAQDKWPALREQYPDVHLHLVGQLQSNKAEDAVALVRLYPLARPAEPGEGAVEGVSRRFIDKSRASCRSTSGPRTRRAAARWPTCPRCSSEARAAGIPLAGLMCVPPADIEPAPFFALLDKLARDHGLEGRSMGMSGDFETAIMLGATHVRVGTALFGER